MPSFKIKSVVQEMIGSLREVLDFAALHPLRAMERAALAETVDYIQKRMSGAVGYYSARQVLDHALALVRADGHLLEFGVYKGGSLRYIAGRSGRPVLGFDSFEGLPEDWHGFRAGKGYFAMGGRPPRVPKNVEIRAGWFDATLPVWLADRSGPVAFLHVDCDLYSSTKTVFDLLDPRLQAGTVIVFDEYFNFPFWRFQEYKAFQEWVARRQVKYRYVAYAKTQVCVLIESLARE